ncbi:MAG: hypothetical protein ABI663_18670 [Chryseolinea sp.]
MYRLTLGILLACFQATLAQSTIDSLKDSYIINTTAYSKGIYKTFEDFKYNKPSIVDPYTFDGKNLWLKDTNTGKLKKIKKKEIWGFSDGTRVYVSWHKYDEVLEKGRYCYFKEKGTKIVFGVTAFPPMILPIPVPYNDELIINFNTGKTYLLSKNLLKKILATDDKELLAEYMKQSKKGKKLFEYIVKYNDRNVAKIK